MHPQPELGSMIAGRYRLVRELGRGGMGVVLEAENAFTGRQVAIKWLHPNLAGNQEAAMRLMREATATSRIRHPNVVDVYDVLNDEDAIYLVMELLEGEPLEALLERGGVPFHELIALLLPAMRGVAEAHRLGIIHRDIHPANIFLSKSAHEERVVPKVLDFGISKVGGEGPSLTRSGTTLGTPLYMSYEQLCSARDVDQRADVYSFGVILYEAMTGQQPFTGDTFAELAVKIATGTPVPPKQLVPALPAALERIILWAMARERDERIPDLHTLIRELEPFATQRAFRAQMTESELSLPSLQARVESASTRPETMPRTPTPVGPRATEPLATPVVLSDARIEPATGLPSASHALRSSPLASSPPERRTKSFLLYPLAVAALIAVGALGWFRLGALKGPQAVGASIDPPAVPATGTFASPAPQQDPARGLASAEPVRDAKQDGARGGTSRAIVDGVLPPPETRPAPGAKVIARPKPAPVAPKPDPRFRTNFRADDFKE